MNISKKRILVVEDEAIVALDICNRLGHLGYELAGRCASGEEAVDLARSLHPDLVLMDIMLEGEMDGVEAAGRIRDLCSTPVVYLTAYADGDTLKRAKVTSPFGYIIKPFENRELQTTIEMALYKFETDARLVRSQKLLATTLQSLGEAVVTTDADNKVRFLNPAAERMLEYNLETAQGRFLADIVNLSCSVPSLRPERSPLAEAKLAPSILRTPSGRTLPVETQSTPLMDDHGRPLGSVLVIRDISDLVRANTAIEQNLANLRDTLEATVEALAVTAEKRDPYTAGHQQRVSSLAVAVARRLGLEEDRVESVRVAGQLHDIGKISVPAEILTKPTRLTPIEMQLVQIHPEVGYDILRNIPFPTPVARFVRAHHERLDGSGYPDRLAGDAIPLEARILCVADVVEAMSSHRPYRPALGVDRALEEVTRNRGRLYDKAVVDACVKVFEEDSFSFDGDGSGC
ncbi:response regulator [Fundidesulfovibrio butyratiphilus]